MKIPTLLENYLEETEQDVDKMSKSELIKEAEWVLYKAKHDPDGFYSDEKIYPSQVKALERFIERMSK